jgi:aspartate/methionine/tyrosine aminotransferase
MITPQVKESVIRLMTRLAIQYKAVNLSQGFPNEPPPAKLRLALAHAVLSGKVWSDDEASRLSYTTANDLSASIVSLLTRPASDTPNDALTDEINQYSPPMGRADVRQAVSEYYRRLYEYDVSEDNITLTLGATEAVATALRTIGSPGDKVVIFEPFHELYPSQCNIFYLDPVYVTLHASDDNGEWNYDYEELKTAITDKKTKALILNTPHNPTGKVFTHLELNEIVNLCIENDVYMITDEIYEHMTYQDKHGNHCQHILIPKSFPEAADRTLVCNSLGKSASATGWRLGWCLHPPHLSSQYRGIHDQLVAMSPHPQQFASLAYFTLPDDYFKDELQMRYQSRVKMLAEALTEVGFGVITPQGAYYLFVDYRGVHQLKEFLPMDAAMYMMRDVGVAVVPGDNFYGKSSDGQHYLRFAACRSLSDVTTAIQKIRAKLSKSV